MKLYRKPVFWLGQMIIGIFQFPLYFGMLLVSWADQCDHAETYEIGDHKFCIECGKHLKT